IRMKKVFLKSVAFILLFALLFRYCNKVLLVKQIAQPWDNYYKVRGFYEEPRDSLDVIFMGSSIAFCGFNPMEMWKNYGITSYVFANGAQTIQLSYYYLQEALKRQKPEVVVLDCANLPTVVEYAKVDSVLVWNLQTMPLSFEKLKLINSYVEPESRFNALFLISNYHTRWKELREIDYRIASEKTGRNVSKGGSYTFYQGGGDAWVKITGRDIDSRDYHKRDGKVMEEITKEWLVKYIQYAKEHGVDVILTKNPQIGEWSQDYTDSIEAVAKEYGVEFWNYADPASISMDLNECFCDVSHMNYWGNVLYSNEIGMRLSEMYDFVDKREIAEYAYWNEDFGQYQKDVEKAAAEYEQLQGGEQ
ncbi:MAG: hypothetical protein ACI4DR_04880, partial [Roseburia sp.]